MWKRPAAVGSHTTREVSIRDIVVRKTYAIVTNPTPETVPKGGVDVGDEPMKSPATLLIPLGEDPG